MVCVCVCVCVCVYVYVQMCANCVNWYKMDINGWILKQVVSVDIKPAKELKKFKINNAYKSKWCQRIKNGVGKPGPKVQTSTLKVENFKCKQKWKKTWCQWMWNLGGFPGPKSKSEIRTTHPNLKLELHTHNRWCQWMWNRGGRQGLRSHTRHKFSKKYS